MDLNLEERIDLLRDSNNRHLCCTCRHLTEDADVIGTTMWESWCDYANEYSGCWSGKKADDWEDEDNGRGFWVIKCPQYIRSDYFYNKYMKSDNWKEKRAKIIERDNYQCRKCGSAKNLCVHHTTYEHLGYEDDTELVTLCKDCHEKVHENDIND